MKARIAKFVGLVGLLILATLLTLVIFRLPIGKSFGWILEGAITSPLAISRTLVNMTPLIFCGLGIAIAWRAGMFNIGGEGQFVVGGIAAASVFRIAPNLPPSLLTILLLLASCIGGALYAWIPAWLYVRRGVLVVISTILLNFVATNLLDYVVKGPLMQKSGGLPLTDRLPEAAMLTRFSPQTDLHSGVILSVLAALCVAVAMGRTKFGLLVDVAGAGPRVLRSLKIDAGSIQLRAMLLSGALCGLAGGVEYTALSGQLGESFAQNWGFLGIPVALLGGLNGFGILFSGLAMGALFAGTNHLSRFTHGGTSLLYVIQAVILFGVLAWTARQESQMSAEGASA